jgi:hypothetical protein
VTQVDRSKGKEEENYKSLPDGHQLHYQLQTGKDTNLPVTGPERTQPPPCYRSAKGTVTARKVIFHNVPTVNVDLHFSFFLSTYIRYKNR